MSLKFDEENHIYTWNDKVVPSVTTVLQELNLVNFSNVPTGVLDRAQKWGKAVHKAIELIEKGKIDEKTLDAKLKPSINAWMRFKSDNNIVNKAIELPIYSNIYGYAGTIDRVCFDKKTSEIYVVDIKTSTSMPGRIAGLQLAAYQQLWAEHSGEGVNKRLIVQLTPEGQYKVKEYKGMEEFNMFLNCLKVYHWKKRRK